LSEAHSKWWRGGDVGLVVLGKFMQRLEEMKCRWASMGLGAERRGAFLGEAVRGSLLQVGTC